MKESALDLIRIDSIFERVSIRFELQEFAVITTIARHEYFLPFPC